MGVEVGIVIGVLAVVAWWLRDGSFRVDEGFVAVVTSFGAAEREGTVLKVREPGLHFKWPWQRVIRVSIREQSLDLGGEQGQTVMADDGTVLRLVSSLRYRPSRDGLDAFLFGLKRPVEHMSGLYACLLRNEIANVSGPVEPAHEQKASTDSGAFGRLRQQRHLLNQRIADFSTRRMGASYGVQFSGVDLTDILPPEELSDALNAVASARAEVEAHHARARSECEQKLMSAQQGIEIARVEARAAAVEMKTIGEHLATLQKNGVLGAYVDRRRTEVLSDSRTLYLNSASEKRP